MREIKFRAWDGESMVSPCNIWDSSDPFTMWLNDLPYPNSILMRFTGLLDKNGTEIYEGDIVYSECCSPDDPAYGHYGETYKVECDAPNGGFNLRDIDGIYTEVDYPEGLEIKGNIYEHPELL